MKCINCPKISDCRIPAKECPDNDWGKARRANDWRNKLTEDERTHLYNATFGKNTLAAFKAAREAKLKQEPIYGCCLDCWIIANKLGIEDTIPKDKLANMRIYVNPLSKLISEDKKNG